MASQANVQNSDPRSEEGVCAQERGGAQGSEPGKTECKELALRLAKLRKLKVSGVQAPMLAQPPPSGPLRVGIVPSAEDWARLEGKVYVYVNDALLDFFLPLLVPPCLRNQIHVFSALFFSRLSEGGWKQVQRWSRPLQRDCDPGVFGRDFLFVPAHDSSTSHWWLAVICFPWAAAKVTTQEQLARRRPQPVVAFLDSCSPPASQSPSELEAASRSAAAARHANALQLIRDYLACEWSTFRPEIGFEESRVQGIHVSAPQQENGTDCGVFVLEFARRLLEERGAVLEAWRTEGLSPQEGEEAAIPALCHPIPADLRQQWRELGVKMLAEKASEESVAPRARPIATPARARAAPGLVLPGVLPPEQPLELQVRKASELPGPSHKRLRRQKSPATSSRDEDPARSNGAVVLGLSEGMEGLLTPAQRETLKKMGATLAKGDTDPKEISHVVVAGMLRRTLRVMLAVCHGKQLVGARWVEASVRAGFWVAERSHRPRGFARIMEEACRKAHERALLAGLAVYTFSSVPESQRKAVAEVVVAAGGKNLDRLPERVTGGSEGHGRGQDKSQPKGPLLIGTDEDFKVARKLGLPLYEPALIFEGAMLQELMFSTHEIP